MSADLATDEAIYREPARGFATSWLLLAVLLAGWILDAALGGAGVHAIAWVAAIIIVVGADVLSIRAARASRSITLTRSELRVGRSALAVSSIVGMAEDVAPSTPVVGLPLGAGLPRGVPGLPLRLEGGATVIVPTRHPDRLAATLSLDRTAPDIRRAAEADLPELAEIERRADTLFAVAGFGALPDVESDALHDPLVVLVAGRPAVGFARVDEVDGQAHLEQLSVLPGHMRRGIGSALLEAACGWATARGYRAITLSTFADVPWNAPFFASRGFEPITELTPELAELRDWERDLGLDRLGPRVVMRRALGDSTA